MSEYDSTLDTMDHIKKVWELGLLVTNRLTDYLNDHDQTKLISPEKEIFDEMTPKLASSTYGSDQYKEYLKHMKVALDHHYERYEHHPEHFENGIKDMSLLNVFEMLIDWKAATLRHDNGDILKSIEINQERFGYSNELKQIFINTVEEMEWENRK